jgi:hypothetical protein
MIPGINYITRALELQSIKTAQYSCIPKFNWFVSSSVMVKLLLKYQGKFTGKSEKIVGFQNSQ